MSVPRVLVLRAPGTNCDVETAHAFEVAGATAERVHVGRLMDNPALYKRYQILCIPGGFSYGDDIAAGRILATRMRHHLDDMIHHFVDSGDNLVLGICNGMQVLMRLGVLTAGIGAPQLATAAGGHEEAQSSWTDDSVSPQHEVPPATLAWNNHGRFEARWVHLAVDQTSCVFLKDIKRMYLPMAHAEGKFVVRDADCLDQLRSAGRLPLRYCDESGEIQSETLHFPSNPNGSDANVAGVSDASGRVFGLMPHPERHVDATQHPFWTRRKTQPVEGDGLAMFRNAVEWFA